MSEDVQTQPAATTAVGRRTVVVVGKENVGKTQLIASLTGRPADVDNFRGSTVSVERYESSREVFFDTPGILRRSDSETTRLALDALQSEDCVLLVVQAVQLDDDLADLLPLVDQKRGAIVLTFWDKVAATDLAVRSIEKISVEVGVPIVPVDARRLSSDDADRIRSALDHEHAFRAKSLSTSFGRRIEPTPGLLDHRWIGPLLAIGMVLSPALITVFGVNRLADLLHPVVAAWLAPVITAIDERGPDWLKLILTARHDDFGYGLLNMGPFLLVWTLPTVLFYGAVVGVYKASGLVERINLALHPWMRPFGLSGRDVVRVLMGFGCNVPAVISTRACSGCSRQAAVSAIAFGSACSYQLPATLAVLGASAEPSGQSPSVLALIFLGYLLTTTLVYLRLTSTPMARNSLNVLVTPRRPFLQWPSPSAIWREASGMLRQFVRQALPVFLLICLGASFLAHLGALDGMSRVVAPALHLFNLPADAALPVILSAVRKDGIFLFAGDGGLAFPMTAAQTLTGVYLAGVLTPCLVTALTIGRELSWRTMAGMLLRQAAFAIACTAILAWGAPLVLHAAGG